MSPDPNSVLFSSLGEFLVIPGHLALVGTYFVQIKGHLAVDPYNASGSLLPSPVCRATRLATSLTLEKSSDMLFSTPSSFPDVARTSHHTDFEPQPQELTRRVQDRS